MSRRVPEFALVVGVFLGLSALVSGVVLGSGLLPTVLFAAVVTYPFVAFGLVRDDDPAAVVPPRWVLLAGVVWASLGVVGVFAADVSLAAIATAGLVGLVLFLPSAAYAVRHGAGVNPLSGVQTLAVAAVAAAGLLVVGLVAGRPLTGVVAAVLAVVSAGLYATALGVEFDARTRRGVVAAGGAFALVLVAVGVLSGGRLADWLLAGAAVAFTPSLYAVLSRTDRRR
jgi:hypothetical protein